MKANIFGFLMQLLVNLPALITSAELAFSGKPGSGEEKKKLVMTTIATGITLASSMAKERITAKQNDAIMDNVSDLTDATVEIMNTVDLFKKPDEAPIPNQP